MKKDHLSELLYQTLETTMNAVAVYTAAIQSTLNTHLKDEWQTSYTRNGNRK